ncbi:MULTISPECIES: DNA primase family protein [unclassified Maridesulfovibrio]|uniref:DNA primase family protein n=1 Tax=unclassified Maridesulfovibrio TaxID=2794999 RepID=UPI003B41E2D2
MSVDNVTNLEEIRKKVAARTDEEEKFGSDDGGPSGISSEFVIQCLRSNEVGDGALFATVHDGKYVYNKQMKEWLKWMGHHWKLDDLDEVEDSVEDVVDKYMETYAELYERIREANDAGDEETVKRNEKLRDMILKRVNKLHSDNGRTKCLKCAHTNRIASARIQGQELDSEPWLLPCTNGVLDLRSGELRGGRPEDYLTKASPVEWQGIDAPRERWDQFILEIMDGDQEMADYLRRLFGCSIVGKVTEHVFAVFHGVGRNGKSLMVDTITEVLGELANPIPAEMLLDQGNARSSAGPSPDIMALRGQRLAFASETDEGRKFSPSRVKWFSGGDKLTGRNGYDKRMITFTPSHMLFLLTNHKPHAPADDFAFWERLQLVPFELSFVDRKPRAPNERPMDKELGDKLKKELSGILAWLAQGCLEWQEQGLNPPAKILEATAEYRRDEDLLEEFLDDCCALDEEERIQATDLYDVFCWWFSRNISKKKNIAQKTFGKLAGKRFEKKKIGTYWYLGVRVLDEIRDEIQRGH